MATIDIDIPTTNTDYDFKDEMYLFLKHLKV